MSRRPTPIAIVTAAPLGPSSNVTFDALASGAVEVLQKPGRSILDSAAERERFARSLRRVAEVGAIGVRGARASFEAPAEVPAAGAHLHGVPADAAVIALGASTGGPPCIRTIVSELDPARSPAVVVVQHMARELVPGFVAWLGGGAPLPVVLAADGMTAEPGRVYVANGDRHLTLDAQGVLREKEGPPRHGQRPAVDVLFESLAEHHGARALGVLLTGMGEDGARGLRAMRGAGAFTVAQEARSCVVSSMPAAASRLDAAVVTANPSGIAWLLRRVKAAAAST